MGPSMYKQSVAISKFLIPLRRFVEIVLSMISRPIWGILGDKTQKQEGIAMVWGDAVLR